jgi:hypothetical protein
MLEGLVEYDFTGTGLGGVGNLQINGRTGRVPACFDADGVWQEPFYWIRLVGVDGLWDNDVLFEKHDLPQRNRSRSGDAYTTGKTLVLTCRIEAKNIAYLRIAQKAVQQAFYDMQPHDLYFELFDSVDVDGNPVATQLVFRGARKNQRIDMPEAQGDLTFRRAFAVQLWIDDPQMYYADGSGTYEAFTTA